VVKGQAGLREKGHGVRQRGREWVSKTDVTRYVRCPYSWWLLDRGSITFEDTVDEFQLRLLLAGTEFHRLTESSAVPIEVEPADWKALRSTDIRILDTPMFENRDLKNFGTPDGIEAAGGALLDIATLCANCHRIAHRVRPWPTVQSLRRLLRHV